MEPASISCWHRVMGRRRKYRVWCWGARKPIRRSTRITRCSTAVTSPGVRRPRQLPWKCTLLLHLIGCLGTKAAKATRAFSMLFWKTPETCGVRSVYGISRSLMSISVPFAKWNKGLLARVSEASCRVGSRLSISRIFLDHPTGFLRTSQSTCG